MRDDPNSPMLFDDVDNEERLRRVAWDCADAVWSVGRRSVRSYDIRHLMDDLIEWCKPCQLNGKHWIPEEQMRWLVRKVRDRGEAVSLKELRRMLLDKFDPASPSGDTFEALDDKIEEWKAESNCKLCVDSGKLLPRERIRLRAPDEFCICAIGQAKREYEARLEEERQKQPVTRRPLARPESLRFDVNLCVHHPGRKRPDGLDKPIAKDWGDLAPMVEQFQSLMTKDPRQWSAEEREFLRRHDKK
jgi:hypothetical protein